MALECKCTPISELPLMRMSTFVGVCALFFLFHHHAVASTQLTKPYVFTQSHRHCPIEMSQSVVKQPSDIVAHSYIFADLCIDRPECWYLFVSVRAVCLLTWSSTTIENKHQDQHIESLAALSSKWCPLQVTEDICDLGFHWNERNMARFP